ncbi:hypothetical protein NMG60_11025156 [Bertholletia excelsa]
MDTQMNGVNGGYESRGKEGTAARASCGPVVLRMLGLALTLAAAVVLGVDKQTEMVQVQLVSTLPPLNVPVTAKWHYMSAFVYFVVANAIACAYAAVALVLALASRGKRGNLALVVTILDLIMVALLFSANGAAGAIGLMGYEGNSHVRWEKVCNKFSRFCHQVAAAILLSLLGRWRFSCLLWLLLSICARNIIKRLGLKEHRMYGRAPAWDHVVYINWKCLYASVCPSQLCGMGNLSFSPLICWPS